MPVGENSTSSMANATVRASVGDFTAAAFLLVVVCPMLGAGPIERDSTAALMRIEPTQQDPLRPPRQQDLSYRLLPEGEDPAELPSHQRRGDLADRKQRQPVVHLVVDHGLIGCLVSAPCKPAGRRFESHSGSFFNFRNFRRPVG